MIKFIAVLCIVLLFVTPVLADPFYLEPGECVDTRFLCMTKTEGIAWILRTEKAEAQNKVYEKYIEEQEEKRPEEIKECAELETTPDTVELDPPEEDKKPEPLTFKPLPVILFTVLATGTAFFLGAVVGYNYYEKPH